MTRTARCACTRSSITLTGEPETLDHDQERFFCAQCGTTLYWHLSSLPRLVGVAGGCFDDPPLGEPSNSYAHDQRLPWVKLPAEWLCSN